MYKNNSQKGFTLVELLLYVSVLVIMLLVISLFLSTLLQSRVKNQTIAEVEQQGLQTMQMITQTVRNASTINTPAVGGGAAALSVGTYISGNNPTLFDMGSGAIRMKEGAAGIVSLTNDRVTVSALNFQNLSHISTPGTIRISFVLTHINPSGRNEYSFSKTFYADASLRQP